MDFVYPVPTDLDSTVLDWYSFGLDSRQIGRSHYDFLCHLSAIKQVVADDVDGAIFIESNTSFAPDFDDKMDVLLDETPGETDSLLLSHYVTNWSKITFEVPNLLCTVNSDVHGSFGYWLSRPWMERCLHLYDRPFRYLSNLDLSPETLTRTPDPQKTYMAYRPLVYKNGPRYDAYFASYR